ncbi:MAG: DUF4276 family protein [Xanthobacteraceae bacterium]
MEILVEEPSMEAFLIQLLPRLLEGRVTFAIHTHQGKRDLIRKLGVRLRGYAKWLPEIVRIIVVLDRDNDDCGALKQRIEQHAIAAGLLTRTAAKGGPWQIVNRLAIEELEAWFFGEWTAVRNAYPKVLADIPAQHAYRNSDMITGGTWEALERILRNAGYFSGGLRKVEAATAIGRHFDHTRAQSPSFIVFRDALLEATINPA